MIPVGVVFTALTAIVTVVGCALFGGRWWGYWPAHLWGRVCCWLTMVSVTVNGRENISKNRSYVFAANHQGAYDIFSLYGYLNHNFKWMMKASLGKIPMVGYACRRSGHVFVDNSSTAAVRRTMAYAKKQISAPGGMSVLIFPEGTRSHDGKMRPFKRGGFKLAEEFALPVVPITIDGAYRVMPRQAKLPRWGHITITIHKPIEPSATDGHADMGAVMQQCHDAIQSALIKK